MHHLKDESPVMGFLDALGMPRAEVRASAATALREKLLSAVPTLPPDRLPRCSWRASRGCASPSSRRWWRSSSSTRPSCRPTRSRR